LGAWYHGKSDEAKIHNYWYTPHKDDLKQLATDQEANQHEGKVHSDYYTNKVEDRGSLSIAVRRPERLQSHADYVRKAIESGKGHEVPEETMKHYKAGTLGVRTVSRAEVSSTLAKRPGKQWPGVSAEPDSAPESFAAIQRAVGPTG
jgi:hypothetical protein